MLILFFTVFSLFNINAASIEKNDVSKVVLKNGMRLVYTPKTWSGDAAVFGLFIRDAGAVKYKGVSGLTSLTERYFSRQLRKLSQRKGFRFYSYLDWDYLSYVFIVPPSLHKDLFQDISRLFWTEITISRDELEAIKKEVSFIGNQNSSFWLTQAPIISFMVPATSIYSNGLYGDVFKLDTIDEKMLSNFIKCYSSPNNSVVVATNTEDIQNFSNNFSQFIPCFRQTDYSLYSEPAEMNLPLKTVKYLSQGNKKRYILRIGLPSYSCNNKNNLTMDILEEVLKNDEELKNITASYKVKNICYKNSGSFELNFNISGIDPKKAEDIILKRSLSIIGNIKNTDFENIKKSLAAKFTNSLSDKRDFVYFVGRSEILSDNFAKIMEYKDGILNSKIEDLKKTSELFNENKVLTYVLWIE